MGEGSSVPSSIDSATYALQQSVAAVKPGLPEKLMRHRSHQRSVIESMMDAVRLGGQGCENMYIWFFSVLKVWKTQTRRESIPLAPNIERQTSGGSRRINQVGG